MNIHHLEKENSLIQQFVSELRDVSIQKDRMRFRKNIERIGQAMAYELSKTLSYEAKNIITPLGSKQVNVLSEYPVLLTILRAGLSMHQGVLSFFDQSDCGFISAYRHHLDAQHFEIVSKYLATPDLTNRTVVLIDPMLATGLSIETAYQSLLTHGTPKSLHIMCLLASNAGVAYLTEKLPFATLWIAALDDEIDAHKYIIPGLGDAGDLCFGEKL